MPHSLFLGSALATQDRISFRADPKEDLDALPSTHHNTINKKDHTNDDSLRNQPRGYLQRLYGRFKKFILDAFIKPPPANANANMNGNGDGERRKNNSFEFVRAHIYYGMFDMVGSLFGFAVMINSLYVILHSVLFFDF